eukprot:GHVU01054309.1.p1 GENE.GHVU01054309.1~~GHVU01054309.1.p1  ORF type:complete len:115 (+),score=9.80 GHVU01054309.1:1550-1894(+)
MTRIGATAVPDTPGVLREGDELVPEEEASAPGQDRALASADAATAFGAAQAKLTFSSYSLNVSVYRFGPASAYEITTCLGPFIQPLIPAIPLLPSLPLSAPTSLLPSIPKSATL